MTYKTEWIKCHVCGNKTRLKVLQNTELKNFPLFCPKCKQETLINVKQLNISVIKEPEHRRRADNTQIKNAVIGFFIYFLGQMKKPPYWTNFS